MAFDAGLVDSAAVELRKTLERAAGHFNDAEGKPIAGTKLPLVRRIGKLIEAGHLALPFKEALHHVRQVGNIGAHAGDERITTESLQATLAFTTQTLRNLVEIPHLLAQLTKQSDEKSGEDDQSDPVVAV